MWRHQYKNPFTSIHSILGSTIKSKISTSVGNQKFTRKDKIPNSKCIFSPQAALFEGSSQSGRRTRWTVCRRHLPASTSSNCRTTRNVAHFAINYVMPSTVIRASNCLKYHTRKHMDINVMSRFYSLLWRSQIRKDDVNSKGFLKTAATIPNRRVGGIYSQRLSPMCQC